MELFWTSSTKEEVQDRSRSSGAFDSANAAKLKEIGLLAIRNLFTPALIPIIAARVARGNGRAISDLDCREMMDRRFVGRHWWYLADVTSTPFSDETTCQWLSIKRMHVTSILCSSRFSSYFLFLPFFSRFRYGSARHLARAKTLLRFVTPHPSHAPKTTNGFRFKDDKRRFDWYERSSDKFSIVRKKQTFCDDRELRCFVLGRWLLAETWILSRAL